VRGPYQEAPEAEAALLVGDRILAVQAAVSLAQRLHGHVALRVAAQGPHRAIAAAGGGGGGERRRDTLRTATSHI